MADEEVVETDGAEESELVVVSAEESAAEEAARKASVEAENKVSMTKEEFEALQRQRDSGTALKEGLEGLASKLSRPVNAPVAQQAPGETDEEFERRVEKELFDNGKTAKVLKEAVVRTVGPILQQMMGLTAEQGKKVLAVDPEKGEYFRRYRKEVEEEYASLPPVERLMPNAYERALDRVLVRKAPEVEGERIEKAVAAKLKELGIEVEGGKVKGKVPAAVNAVESGGAIAPSGKKQVRIVMSADERARLERKAEENGMEFQDYLRAIGKVKE